MVALKSSSIATVRVVASCRMKTTLLYPAETDKLPKIKVIAKVIR